MLIGFAYFRIKKRSPLDFAVSIFRYDLAKAELASSYDSHHHRSKDKFPHRVNGVVTLCHKIFRPDPEEVKRRIKLKKKKMEEEGQEEQDQEKEVCLVATPP